MARLTGSTGLIDPVLTDRAVPAERPAARRMRTARLSLPALTRIGSTEYHLLGAITLFLSAFGLVMVLSSSSVEQGEDGGDPFAHFQKQAMALFLGLAVMLLASRAAPGLWRRLAPIALVISVAVQLLTALTPIGTSVYGNQNWIQAGPLSLQPSEFVKFALVLCAASFFSRRPGRTATLRDLTPLLAQGAVAIGSVALGHDMGTCTVMGVIVLAGLFFADVPARVLAAVVTVTAAAGALFLLTGGSRVTRFTAWAHGCAGQQLDACWQSVQGTWALAAGGVFGVGLGNSVSKWSWLPEADNDFILAIIGEETGLIGLTVLLGLFVALTVAFLRITTRTRDPFTRIAAGMTLAWIVGQALTNMAVVLGMLPVLGVPLPFISSGGSSMVANLLAIGCVMSLANAERTALPEPA
ncbi:FtsW/RodA/SpoVE family cell cycle protein [uncultured Amnibacterium sp.]|uniref:FtsW/RodA/SpoVE family cell cycle protein n=1 Tax=uncultured Amnibacterium sp. TaxID=1631851 RepID=UPI0035C94B02